MKRIIIMKSVEILVLMEGTWYLIIAETVTNKIHIFAAKSIFLHAAWRYVNETIYIKFS